MSANTIEAGSPSAGANGVAPKDGTLTPAAKEALLARARDIIAGRVKPPRMEAPPGRLEAFHKEFAGYDPPPTEEAIRFFTEQWHLDYTYRGKSVVCCRTSEGDLAVLGVGEEEIVAILLGLDDEEQSKVVVMDTQFEVAIPVNS
jgi:hypothetical protein